MQTCYLLKYTIIVENDFSKAPLTLLWIRLKGKELWEIENEIACQLSFQNMLACRETSFISVSLTQVLWYPFYSERSCEWDSNFSKAIWSAELGPSVEFLTPGSLVSVSLNNPQSIYTTHTDRHSTCSTTTVSPPN